MGTDSKIFRPRRFARSARSLATALALGLVALAGAVPAANAEGDLDPTESAMTGGKGWSQTPCPEAIAEYPFKRFGDNAQYGLVSRGDFESSSRGWSMQNAGIELGNEELGVRAGTRSLKLAPGAVVTSPAHCVGAEYPYFRFLAQGRSGSLKVEVIATESGYVIGVGRLYATRSWQVSPILSAAAALPLHPGNYTQIQFRFTVVGASNPWAIDNVYLDPTHRR